MASLALGVGTAALADASPPRFDLQASMQAKSTGQVGSGFELRAQLTPARTRAEGGGYAVDAVAAPAVACGGDLIFQDGFDSRDSLLHSRD